MTILLEKIISEEINKLDLKNKMTGYLVKKKKRGTYQALSECESLEEELRSDIVQYIKRWMKEELLYGSLRKNIVCELKSQVNLELARKGFIGIVVE